MKVMYLVAAVTVAVIVGTAVSPSFAQGPAGLNFSGGGPMQYPWSGTASGHDSPVSGSAQDPDMQHAPVSVPQAPRQLYMYAPGGSRHAKPENDKSHR
jgi:hypothetical protein